MTGFLKVSILSDLQDRIGYSFKDSHLLEKALTHASVQSAQFDNERLEFLGDRVAGVVVADMIFHTFKGEDEGHLAKRHTALVQKAAMVRVANMIDLAAYLKLSPGEEQTGGKQKDTILGDATEALIGAIYLDGGFEAAFAFIKKFWTEMLQTQTAPPIDPKSALQEWAQGRNLPLPVYTLVARTGKDHAPAFEIEVKVETMGAVRATAKSKRQAEKDAAALLLDQIEDSI